MPVRRKRLSPTVMQGLIWGGAIAACAAFAVVVFVVSGRGRPVLPEPKTIPVGPEVAPRGETPAPAAEPSLEAPLPEPAGDRPAAGAKAAEPTPPRELTEALYVELAAQMLVAAESFTDSEVGQKSFGRACQGILERGGVSRADFERMSDEIARDPSWEARMVDQVAERADQLKQPTNVRAGAGPEGVVDPRRAPPPPPTPPR